MFENVAISRDQGVALGLVCGIHVQDIPTVLGPDNVADLCIERRALKVPVRSLKFTIR